MLGRSLTIVLCAAMLGMINRAFKYKTKEVILKLYKSLVRPHMEYCIQAWRSFKQKDIDVLESIQRRMSRIIPELRIVNDWNRLPRSAVMSASVNQFKGHIDKYLRNRVEDYTSQRLTPFLVCQEKAVCQEKPATLTTAFNLRNKIKNTKNNQQEQEESYFGCIYGVSCRLELRFVHSGRRPCYQLAHDTRIKNTKWVSRSTGKNVMFDLTTTRVYSSTKCGADQETLRNIE